jgi:hypothetical protein
MVIVIGVGDKYKYQVIALFLIDPDEFLIDVQIAGLGIPHPRPGYRSKRGGEDSCYFVKITLLQGVSAI